MDFNSIIQIKGLPEEDIPKCQVLFADMVKSVFEDRARYSTAYNITNLDRIILTKEYGRELSSLAKEQGLGLDIKYTDESYGQGQAKVLQIPKGNDFLQVMVFNLAHSFEAILVQLEIKKTIEDLEITKTSLEESATIKKKLATIKEKLATQLEYSKYVIAHELGHVHEKTQIPELLKSRLQEQKCSAKEYHAQPIAKSCWSEYYACFLASFSVTSSVGESHLSGFFDAHRNIKQLVDEQILEYRCGKINLEELLSYTAQHMKALLNFTCYVLGWLDGARTEPEGVIERINTVIKGSYFEEVYFALRDELRNMNSDFPEAWEDDSVHGGLMDVVVLCFGKMGLVMSFPQEDGVKVKIDVPIRPETDSYEHEMPV